MSEVSREVRRKMVDFAHALIDPKRARVLVSPHEEHEGFWFGAGNLVRDRSGAFFLVGRYRDMGDSRTGLGKGRRGVELAIFGSTDGAATFTKLLAFSKSDLNVGEREVISIEGAKLHFTGEGVELFVSTEKSGIEYPNGFREFLKPGAGVWTIDRISAPTVAELSGRKPQTLIEGHDPRWLHVKDPVVFDSAEGDTLLYFCTHPYSWSSSNTALAVRRGADQAFSEPDYQFFPRGTTWDVSMTRVTGLCPVPVASPRRSDSEKSGAPILVFYDGGEAMRNFEEHANAVKRPRGYSCEELGGLGLITGSGFRSIERLSPDRPAFVSPYGTGCLRYVDVLETQSGYYATWQQSQPDRSQPLLLNVLSRDETKRILGEPA